MRTALVTLLLAGCAYDAGSFRSPLAPFSGTPITIGCLDLTVARGSDSFTRGALVEVSFGNRCDHRITLDLTSLNATAHGVRLTVWDPRRELEVAALPARMSGTETFEYREAAPDEQVCIDIGGVNREAPRTENWVCL